MHSSPRFARLTGAVAAIALLASACSSSGDEDDGSGPASVTAVGGGASMSYAVPELMDAMNIGENHDIDLDYTGSGTSSTNMVAAVLSGDADFAFPASTTAVDAIHNGADLVIVASFLSFASILGISTKAAEESGVSADAPVADRLAALEGLTIATSPEGSGNNALLRQILSAAGMDPDKDVEIVGVQDPSAIVGGIKQGRFDAGFYGSGVIEANIAAGDAELWISTARGDVTDLVGDQVGGVMVTSKRTLAKRPDVVSRMFDAVVETEQLIAEDPATAGAELKKTWFPDLDQRTFDIAWGEAQHAYPADGRLSTEQFDTLLDLLSKSGKDYDVSYDDVIYEKAARTS